MITDINQLDQNKRYTYADYLTWEFTEIVELIRGKIFRMSPASGTMHQRISGSLFRIISSFLLGKPCEVFSAPFDVRLPLPHSRQANDRIDTVVQPDISVICDSSKLDEHGCNGAPDWIIEILSKSTSSKDLIDKFDIYQHAGVREYWVVHPHEGTVLPYRLDEDGQFQLLRKNPFVREEIVPVGVFPGFSISLEDIFPGE